MEGRRSEIYQNRIGENKEKHDLKVVAGVECRIVKPSVEDEENVKTIHAHTMPEALYSKDAVDKFSESKRGIFPAKRLRTK